MKKVLILMLLLSMTLCFAACGGSEKEATPTQAVSEDATGDETSADAEAAETEADTTEADQTTDDQALAEADYNQLLTFMEGLDNHSTMKEQLTTYREQYDAGDLTIEDLISAYQQLSDDSQSLLGSLQSSVWSSDAYPDQIALLTETLEALAQGEALNTEAIVNNDEAKLTEADTYMNTYNEKFDAFLTSMGV